MMLTGDVLLKNFAHLVLRLAVGGGGLRAKSILPAGTIVENLVVLSRCSALEYIQFLNCRESQ